jgi:DNA mismatch endonuclease, patch repair protein
VDRVTREKRSALMAGIRKEDTWPELVVRRLLHRLGFRFRLHRRDLPGRPDLVLPRHRTAVFVHGCFWHCHTCPKGTTKPVNNRAFWHKKLADNEARDARNRQLLEAAGWHVVVVWECETASADLLTRKLCQTLKPPATRSSRRSRGRAG